jgi:uncharacterized protein involved in type VI secretion and phage assembly
MNSIEVIKKIAREEAGKLHMIELGLVTSIFPHSDEGDGDNYECNVKIKNRDLELRKVPVATQHIGFTYIPNVGDMVILAFINGNINAPVIIGRLYNDEDKPPVNNAGEIIYESPDEKKDGIRRLYMKFPNGISLTIKDDELKAEVGKTVVTIKTDGDISIDSNAKISVTSKGDTTIKADGDVSLEGKNVSIESQMGLKIRSGTDTEINAGSSAKLQASSTLDIKGSMVNIN